MCVIVYKPKGVALDPQELHLMWRRNKDGLGFSAFKNSNWFHKKGFMEKDEGLNCLLPFLDKDSLLVFHMRLQSRGGLSPEMTHPFCWSNSSQKRLIFHNGTVTFLSGGSCSDSSVLSSLLSPLKTDQAYDILENLAASGFGRFITIVFDKKSGAEIKVFEGKESVWRNGIWYSNLIHEQLEKVEVKSQLHLPLTAAEKKYYSPQVPKIETNQNENIQKIIAFYLHSNNLKDTATNRKYIEQTYSLNLMRHEFIEKIANSIEEGTNKDPIKTFFQS